MPFETVHKDQLHAVIVAALTEHPAMHGRVADIPAYLPISEEWHQLDPSRANWGISLPPGTSPSLTLAIREVIAVLQQRYRLDMPPLGSTVQP